MEKEQIDYTTNDITVLIAKEEKVKPIGNDQSLLTTTKSPSEDESDYAEVLIDLLIEE